MMSADNFFTPTFDFEKEKLSVLEYVLMKKNQDTSEAVFYEKYLENWKPNAQGRDYTWLLNTCRAATTIILNMDYSSGQLKVWSGYILTLAKTYFVNSNFDDAQSYSVLNRNKIGRMHELFPKIKRNIDSK